MVSVSRRPSSGYLGLRRRAVGNIVERLGDKGTQPRHDVILLTRQFLIIGRGERAGSRRDVNNPWRTALATIHHCIRRAAHPKSVDSKTMVIAARAERQDVRHRAALSLFLEFRARDRSCG